MKNLYFVIVRIETKDEKLVDQTEILTESPEEAVLDVLHNFGNLLPSVLDRLLAWGRDLREVPSVSVFSAGLPGGCLLHASGSVTYAPHPAHFDEG